MAAFAGRRCQSTSSVLRGVNDDVARADRRTLERLPSAPHRAGCRRPPRCQPMSGFSRLTWPSCRLMCLVVLAASILAGRNGTGIRLGCAPDNGFLLTDGAQAAKDSPALVLLC